MGEHPPTQHEFASSLGSQLLWLLLLPLGGGQEGLSRDSSPWHSCTGALCGSQEPGMAAPPQMEDGTLEVVTVCCFAAPKKPEGCLVLLLCCSVLNCTKPHAPLCYP